MPLYKVPDLTQEDHAVVEMINELRQRLRHYVQANPQRWSGMLRRSTIARAIQGSNSIEGYHATMDDAIAAVDDEEPMDANEKTWREIIGYRNAMTYILQLSEDGQFEYHPQLIRSLHFMMLQHSLKKMPGRWRPDDVYVVNEATDERVYEGPDALLIPQLIDELVAYLNTPTECPVVVKAAMAHLNFTMIHPLKDGNGRMARALQTLVLSRDGIISPVFSSIEEWLGRNTPAYYDILAQTGQGSWQPGNDAHAWIQFCLRAHFQQAQTIVRRNEWYGKIYGEISRISASNGLNDRMNIALMDGALGFRVRAGQYRSENDLSDVVASRDLRKLCEVELLIPHGERRGRYYTGSKRLQDIAQRTKITGRADDPYALIRERNEIELSPQLPL
ncbi:MAG: Fic family protein [Proteobacteria bacterium]|nr:Fic family protein [Pseudomonadota bacterium]